MNRVSFFLVPFSLLLGLNYSLFSSGVGGYSASNTFTVNSGNSTNPTYQISSAAIAGDAVYSGVVSSSDSSSVTFATGTDENNVTTYPFAGANVFNPNAQIPNLTANGTGSSVTVSYPGGYDATGSGFASAPEIIIDAPSGGGDTSTATATISSGEITGITVTAGSGYTQAPAVTVVGGPHFLRNTTETSTNYGRGFFFPANTTTSLTIDMTRIAAGESATASSFFAVGDTVEVIPAPTLGSVFGADTGDLPTNWTTGFPNSSDWVYLWDNTLKGYFAYCHLGSSYEPGLKRGWYNTYSIADGVKNNKVLYPDEAFIIAKKTANSVTFTFEGTVQTNDQKMFLPEGYNQVLMNNPYGTDLTLGELVPSTSIGVGDASKFSPGASSSAANTDTISFLNASGGWDTFYYKSSATTNVTKMHVLGTRSPNGGSSSAALDSNDFYIGSGAITALDSCTDAAGTNVLTGSNDGNYTKITVSGIVSDNLGFTISLNSVQGYKLNDDGSKEANASTGVEVESPARGTIIYSNLIGSHEIVGNGSGFVVIEKQRDINLKADEQDASASNATVTWSIGTLGEKSTGGGYTGKFFCVGGGGPDANATNACQGDIAADGSVSNVTGSGTYSSAPQAVVTGGGWRTGSAPNAYGNYLVGSSSGVLIFRGYTSGTKTFLSSTNPNQ